MRRALLSLALVLTTACSDSSDPFTPTQQLTLAPVYGTLYSNIRDARRIIIRDQATWSALWAEMGTLTSPATPPVIDFTREDVIVVTMGERRSAGFAIDIVDATDRNGTLMVDVASAAPGPTCTSSDVVTTPLDAVRVPKIRGAVTFAERTVVLSCS